jgi:hypothetical protein
LQYGPIFETRWPGKKFKGSRRFVYLQFLSPVRMPPSLLVTGSSSDVHRHSHLQSSASAALELNGRELEPGHALLVAVSDPARKQTRSDAKASEKEVVISQMSKFVKKDDLMKLFKPVSLVRAQASHVPEAPG